MNNILVPVFAFTEVLNMTDISQLKDVIAEKDKEILELKQKLLDQVLLVVWYHINWQKSEGSVLSPSQMTNPV